MPEDKKRKRSRTIFKLMKNSAKLESVKNAFSVRRYDKKQDFQHSFSFFYSLNS